MRQKIRQWLTQVVLVLLVGAVLVACGGNAPTSVVAEALRYDIAHLEGAEGLLVGHELLEQWTEVQDIEVRSQHFVRLPTVREEIYPGYDISGSYTLAVRLPYRKTRYKRRGEPFQLTLAQLQNDTDDRPIWRLAYPQSQQGDRPVWQLVEFRPEVPLPVESELTEENRLSDSTDSDSTDSGETEEPALTQP
ncbi:hypothetical protein [Synechococcus sp. PCC 7336]|uniref:hypothetical protein n=1 Tax=Synechococcus sp. PCC 7336 TaxID=195250 RepID=UPI00034549BE|nr:hypothetical protein [Synechococcus sp. PCC 7336]